jgi:hypothetical protein
MLRRKRVQPFGLTPPTPTFSLDWVLVGQGAELVSSHEVS